MYADDILEQYRSVLSLGDWDIRVAGSFDASRGEEAYVIRQDDEHVATMYIDPRATEAQRRRLVVHELLHLVLADLEFLASNGRSTDMMDIIHRTLEHAISRLVGAITNDFLWDPIDEDQRRAHDFE